jgi:hypothetical protein
MMLVGRELRLEIERARAARELRVEIDTAREAARERAAAQRKTLKLGID